MLRDFCLFCVLMPAPHLSFSSESSCLHECRRSNLPEATKVEIDIMSDTPHNPNAKPGGDHDVEHIRRGGLRRLRAGLPLEVTATSDGHTRAATTSSLPAFTAEVERQIQAAQQEEKTALLARADHRPIPLPAGPVSYTHLTLPTTLRL